MWQISSHKQGGLSEQCINATIHYVFPSAKQNAQLSYLGTRLNRVDSRLDHQKTNSKAIS